LYCYEAVLEMVFKFSRKFHYVVKPRAIFYHIRGAKDQADGMSAKYGCQMKCG